MHMSQLCISICMLCAYIYTYAYIHIYNIHIHIHNIYIYTYICVCVQRHWQFTSSFSARASLRLRKLGDPRLGGRRLAQRGGLRVLPPKEGSFPIPPNVALLRALWSLLVGIWGTLKGTWGVLVWVGISS